MLNLPVDLVLPARTNWGNAINFIEEYNRWTHLICLQFEDGKKKIDKTDTQETYLIKLYTKIYRNNKWKNCSQ